ncbi:glycerol-3-phosphate dehydrogenase 1-like protein isoform X3 [Ahaetulla prasina]|uniref:glycerol-3-phosphate dehydrogenase 1-like protein isoform X3 n=1 Tax=Ahaetulla prasina TaxID=499056 RepID=UPI002647325B|nr:glycerol-3-phosphate dehydrogenase 1-like protein isoform X3 [Ahaetulla prasina]
MKCSPNSKKCRRKREKCLLIDVDYNSQQAPEEGVFRLCVEAGLEAGLIASLMLVLHGRWRFLCSGQLVGFLSSFALGFFSAGACPQRLTMAGASAPLKVCIVGSGNWGSAVAKIIGNNVKTMQKFASTVKMWVFEETINGRKLTDIINNDHENVKYLPGYKLPENVVAVPNLTEAVKDADLLVFVIPHQFIYKICDAITGHLTKQAVGITLIKGIDEGPEGLRLISDVIRAKMGIDISVLMGANIANEVAAEKFCETTIGCKILENGLLFKELLQTPNFRITVVDDADTVEICGALKSIEELEQEMLNGQKLQGPQTSAEVYRILQQKGLVEKFPLFTAVYKICYEGKPVQEMISCLQSHPEHI